MVLKVFLFLLTSFCAAYLGGTATWDKLNDENKKFAFKDFGYFIATLVIILSGLLGLIYEYHTKTMDDANQATTAARFSSKQDSLGKQFVVCEKTNTLCEMQFHNKGGSGMM